MKQQEHDGTDDPVERRIADMRRGVARPPDGQRFFDAACAATLGFAVLCWFSTWAALVAGAVVGLVAYLFSRKR